ncbi:MAG TPA: cupin domain-containing protein [Gaiellaceae bacterium]
MELDVHPLLLAPGEGETVTDRPERTLRILAELEQLIVTWFRYEPGERGPDPHIHRLHTDAFYVLEGEVEFGLGPEVTSIRGVPGTYAAAPPGVVHTFKNSSAKTAVFLNIHAPSSGFGDLLRGGSEEHFDQEAPPPDGGRPLTDAIASGSGEGERHERKSGLIIVKGDLPQLSVLELAFEPGWEGVAPHRHHDHVDAFFVLEGEIEFLLGKEKRQAGPGTFVAAPPGESHGFKLANDAPVRVLNLHAPETGFVDRVRRG